MIARVEDVQGNAIPTNTNQPWSNVDQDEVLEDDMPLSGQNVDEEEIPEAIVPDQVIATVDSAVSWGEDEDTRIFKTPVVSANETLFAIAPQSSLSWVGRKIGWSHDGTLMISQWSVVVRDEQVVAWMIEIDMNTLRVLDSLWGNALEQHLKSDDFFSVSTYPFAYFTLNRVSAGQIVGTLTLRGVTKQITFPAVVIVEDDSVVVTAQFAFDRTQWWINGAIPMASEFIELSFTLRFTLS